MPNMMFVRPAVLRKLKRTYVQNSVLYIGGLQLSERYKLFRKKGLENKILQLNQSDSCE